MIQRPVAPWRIALRWFAALAVVLIPFAQVRGGSLLRIDTTTRSLWFLGRAHPLEQMFLLLLLCLFLVCVFLLLTVILGRVWCGWACPQTALTDLTDAVARWLGPGRRTSDRRSARLLRSVALHGVYALLALLVAANLVWYFLDPYEFFRRLGAGALPFPAVVMLGAVGGAVYADLAFVRRTLCRSLCPYGRFQAALADAGTLTIQLLPDQAESCLHCGACQRACPTGIDIREGGGGQQVECINCGRCRDACAAVMARKGRSGLIGFGAVGGSFGLRAFLNPRIALLVVAAVGSLTALTVAASRWEPVSLSLRRPPARDRLLPDGRTAAFFAVDVSSRADKPLALELEAAEPGGGPLETRGGPGRFVLSPREHRHLSIAVLLPPGAPPVSVSVVFRARDPRGALLSSATARATRAVP